MKTALVWLLIAITLPFRLAVVLLIAGVGLPIVLGLGVIFMAADPARMVDELDDLLFNSDWAAMRRFVLLGES